jgi:uncharacterized protein YciW
MRSPDTPDTVDTPDTPDTVDTVDTLLGDAAPAVAPLRSARPEVIVHTEGAHRALFQPKEPGGLSISDRRAVALRVAAVTLGPDAAAVAHYRSGLDPLAAERILDGRVTDPRLAAVLRHADLLTARPSAATAAHHQPLLEKGLAVADIVTLSQLIAYLSYQVRVVTGLAAIAATSAAPDEGILR